MAFPLEESSPLNGEQRVSIIGSVPGEGIQTTPETTSESPVTTTLTPTTEESPVTTEDSDKKLDDIEGQNNENSGLIIANADDEDDRNGETGEEKTNPRLVFIERLMGLHLTAPLNGQKEAERDDNSAVDSEPQMPFSMDGSRNPFDKVNAKWSTRMRKFSIPLLQQQQQFTPPETPNPLLRVAAAAMMTRLLAAAARAHNNGPMMGKDKDDEGEDETVPILLASMRSDDNREPPMYGRPMPRPPMMRPPMRPPIKIIGQPQQRMGSVNIPQRIYSAQMIPQRSPVVQQRALPPYQPVIVMLAHVPMQMAESRMGASQERYNDLGPYYASQPQQHSMPIYPQVPYALPIGYHPMQRQMGQMEMPTPVHIPIPVASYHRPVYQSPYQSYQREPNQYQSQYPSQYQRQSSRPVIEIPIEIPIPVHVPSATKLKLWREYVGAKHAAQPGVRYIPVAVNTADDSQTLPAGNHDNSDSQPNQDQSEAMAESHSQPAFVILTDDSPDGQPIDAPQHH
ncbi:unnamed protein product [Medioppia subpectinata]|uniref:Uncharacterized protein n=1 Tax=Medioppia subpectinata TaxID=1979941 RepID=A0A7R9KKX9_9ACAR|nr:unnamed protein product [Medioppia subpectinata]CAG2104158.1 unnamed protein product [Medioppia subpectinata]